VAKTRLFYQRVWRSRSTLDANQSPQRRIIYLGHRGSAARLAAMKIYRGFPQRLHHRVPHWVEGGALFHIRIALDRENEQRP
jgi:hypothetical protein